MALFGDLFKRNPEKSKLEKRRRELSELREVLRGEEVKLNLALRDLDECKRQEDDFLEKGRVEASESAKRTVAFRIKDVRDKQRSLESRMSIYHSRIKVLREQVSCLETLVEAGATGLPNEAQIEQVSLEASQKMEQLNGLLQKIEGTRPADAPKAEEPDSISSILREFDGRADRDLRRAEEGGRRKASREKSPREEE